MMDASGTAASLPEHEWRRRFISDLFHTLAQPLTALHCSLELALMKDDPEQCRRAIADALDATDRLIATTTFLRESGYAEDPGEPSGVDAANLLLKVVDELAPVAEAGKVQVEAKIQLQIGVFADAAKLEQAFFLLMNESLSGIAEGGSMRICAEVDGENAIFKVRGMRADRFDAGSRAMKIASKIFDAVHGELNCSVEHESVCVAARLPRYCPAAPLRA